MIALCYADLHATDNHERCFSDPSVSLQHARVAKFYADLLSIYKEYKCDCLWDLGDTTDDRNAIPLPTIDLLGECLSMFPASPWNLKLVGNHEQYVRSTRVHVGQLFQPYFNIVDEVSVFTTGKTSIVCCAYPANEADLSKWLDTVRVDHLRSKAPAILLAHVQVRGSFGAAGQIAEGIDVAALKWANLGLLGHVHRPQTVAPNIHYVGSPFQQDWGERGEAKRVGIVDTDACTVQWITLEGYPQYQEVTLEDFTSRPSEVTEDRYRVVLRNTDEAAKFYALPDATRAEPVYEFSSAAPTEVTGQGSALGKWDTCEMMKRYLLAHPPSESSIAISADDMLEFGREIMLP